jgi:hypothetical protein
MIEIFAQTGILIISLDHILMDVKMIIDANIVTVGKNSNIIQETIKLMHASSFIDVRKLIVLTFIMMRING